MCLFYRRNKQNIHPEEVDILLECHSICDIWNYILLAYFSFWLGNKNWATLQSTHKQNSTSWLRQVNKLITPESFMHVKNVVTYPGRNKPWTYKRPYICKECGHTFSKPHHLKEHKSIHSEEMPFCCNFCQQSFRLKTLWSLIQNVIERIQLALSVEKYFHTQNFLNITCAAMQRNNWTVRNCMEGR